MFPKDTVDTHGRQCLLSLPPTLRFQCTFTGGDCVAALQWRRPGWWAAVAKSGSPLKTSHQLWFKVSPYKKKKALSPHVPTVKQPHWSAAQVAHFRARPAQSEWLVARLGKCQTVTGLDFFLSCGSQLAPHNCCSGYCPFTTCGATNDHRKATAVGCFNGEQGRKCVFSHPRLIANQPIHPRNTNQQLNGTAGFIPR